VAILDIRITSEGSRTTVVLAGIIDRDGADEVGQAVLAAAGRQGCELEIDLKDVTFLGSSGIARFLQVQNVVSSAGGQFRIIRLNPDLEALFKANHFDTLISVGRSSVKADIP
jgi:anti-anti-sigma factor